MIKYNELIELGTWAKMTAWWGYNDDYDAVGILLVMKSPADFHFYASDDLAAMLYTIGSMGMYELVYGHPAKWQAIPELVKFHTTFEHWGR